MTTYQILYWHDIPVQVRAGGRRDRFSVVLPERFQIAVDSAAMAAGLAETDEYLAGFHWSEPAEQDGTAPEVAAAVASALQAAHATIDWRMTAEKARAARSSQ